MTPVLRSALLFCGLGLAWEMACAATQAIDVKINFPDIPGYCTLKCDFHVHTVFFNGRVWPSIRVEESLREGLDAIALTDHLEYRPHLADIPGPDHNKSYDIARAAVKGRDLLVVRGAEITRSMPPDVPLHALSGGDRHDKFGDRHDGSGGVGRSVTINESGSNASPR